MAKVDVSVEVSKELYEVIKGIEGVVAAAKSALADGWQVGQDLPVLMSAAITNLIPAMQGADKVAAEIKEDAAASAMAAAVGGAAIAKLFMAKE